jgi:putative transposase
MRDSSLFRNTYRIKSIRWPGRDYGAPGRYFITICTKFREPWFGSVQNGHTHLSAIGEIADQCWRDIPLHFPNVIPDIHVVMPDHVHGVVIIGETSRDDAMVETCDSHVSTNAPTNRRSSNNVLIIPRPCPGSLGSIINQYKTACTKRIRLIEPDFAWQSRFHDRVIRDDAAYAHIRTYIRNNPARWTGK